MNVNQHTTQPSTHDIAEAWVPGIEHSQQIVFRASEHPELKLDLTQKEAPLPVTAEAVDHAERHTSQTRVTTVAASSSSAEILAYDASAHHSEDKVHLTLCALHSYVEHP